MGMIKGGMGFILLYGIWEIGSYFMIIYLFGKILNIRWKNIFKVICVFIGVGRCEKWLLSILVFILRNFICGLIFSNILSH